MGSFYKIWLLQLGKTPIETLHLDFCKRILKVQRKTPNNRYRAELGQYPLLLNIQKRAIKFWKHLKTSDPNTYHYKAGHTHTHIRPTHIINTEKHKYITHWTNSIKNQHKLECYSALNREYTMASYLSAVTGVKLRKTLTMYRLSEHSLAVETGQSRHTWLSHEDRLCSHCMLGVTETELHFLTECPKRYL